MAHSIEILPDPDLESAIRDQWSRLEAAGLPNAGRVRANTNRPHCTLIAGTSISPTADASLATAAQRLPFELRVGGAVVFPAGRNFALARAVVPSTELLSTQATIVRLAGDCVVTPAAHCRPGAWTPHIALGLRLTSAEAAAALDLLSWEPVVGRAADLRRWDGDTRTAVIIAGRSC